MKGREGFGILSSSRRACEAEFGVFVETEYSFSIAPEECFGEVTRMFFTGKYSPDAGCRGIGRWPSIRCVLAKLHSLCSASARGRVLRHTLAKPY